jgi:hypothetical protein
MYTSLSTSLVCDFWQPQVFTSEVRISANLHDHCMSPVPQWSRCRSLVASLPATAPRSRFSIVVMVARLSGRRRCYVVVKVLWFLSLFCCCCCGGGGGWGVGGWMGGWVDWWVVVAVVAGDDHFTKASTVA